jgi:hypothetical protein
MTEKKESLPCDNCIDDVVDDAVLLAVAGDYRFVHAQRILLSLLGNFARAR